VELRILGPLEVRTEEGVVSLPRRRERALLVALVLHPGEVVSTDRLIEAIWGEEPPRTAHGSLQNAVSELRKALGHDVLGTRAPGYRLQVDPEDVDARRFERALRDAPGLSPPERVEQLTAALALWRGPALADLADEPFARHEAARLDELRLGAIEDRLDAELELGRGPDLVAELEAHVAAHPLRERLRGQLMLALYRAGRQAEALEAYQEARHALVEGLGIDPSPALAGLERQILRQDPALVTAGDPPEPAAPARAPALRKTVTVLAAALDGVAGLDPEPLRERVERFLAAVRSSAARHGGTLDRFLGSEATAVFGVPALHEDDALRAARAAIELREALRADNLPVRVGIATGEALVGEGEMPVVGDVVDVAVALREACARDEILVGPATRELLGGAATTGGTRRATTRGVEASLLESVSGARAVTAFPRTPFVGRERELAAIRDALAQATAERRCATVTVLGEAGIGKTRLASELAPTLVRGRVLTGRCAPYAEGATYAPVLELVEQAAGGLTVDAVSSLLPDDADRGRAAEHLADLEGGAATVPRGEAFWSVRTLLEALAEEEPVIAVLDDLHWAEPALLDLVEYLAERVEAPVVLLCLARPELLDDRAGWGGATSQVSIVHVDPLTPEESHELLGALDAEQLTRRARNRLVERAEGNALHLQQLHALVVEEGVEALESVPPSIEAVLASRIDRLGADARSTLQRAAVAGREFTRGIVVALAEPGAPVDASLLELTRRSLVHPERSPGPDDAYRFHHILLRDVAYSSMPKAKRAELHERAAAWLDRDGPGPDLLVGYHLEQAHACRVGLGHDPATLDELAASAADRLFATAMDAARGGDVAALGLFARTAAIAPDHRRRTLALVELAPWLQTVGDVTRKREVLAEALKLARALGDPALEARARIEIGWDEAGVRTERTMESFGQLARELIPTLEGAGDARGLMRATRFLASVHLYHEQLAQMEQAAMVTAAAARQAGWPDDVANVLVATALVHGPARAPEALGRVMALRDGMASSGRRAAVSSLLSILHAMVGDTRAARELATSAREVINSLGDDLELIASWFPNRLFVHLLEGETGEALELIAEWTEALEQSGNDAYLSTALVEHALLIVEIDAAAATQLHEQATRLASPDDRLVQALLRAVAARIRALHGRDDEALRLSQDAIDVLSTTDAVRDRARVSLCRARVLELTGDAVPSAAALEDARRLFDAKGNIRAVQSIDRHGTQAVT
jgi:DNA-binding SARP family transcriptional activator